MVAVNAPVNLTVIEVRVIKKLALNTFGASFLFTVALVE